MLGPDAGSLLTEKLSCRLVHGHRDFVGGSCTILTGLHADPDFERSLKGLTDLGCQHRTAIMCAEARLARAVPVEHRISKSSRKVHTYTPFERVEGEKVTYPREAASLFE